LSDEVEVRRGAPGVRLRVAGGIDAGPPERNLATRAAEAFYGALGEPPAVEVALEKRIPAAAGLGGGSSDAAAVLRALDRLHGEPLGRAGLLRLAAGLGSDVPFFLCGSPRALAWGRGERLLSLPPLPARPVVVATPGTALSTADAFAAVAARRGGAHPPTPVLISPEDLGSWEGTATLAVNDFEPVALERIPGLAQALAILRRSGAEIALLAGSGSSVFGVFASASARDAALPQLEALGMACRRAETRTAEPEPQVDPAADLG
ncbi:MAG TPA: hypothetical protein VFX98_14765, partial [Longimicrobiaceae bacterium]|nr:hypothetical protein [Longimicrobiaceae bacterium]